MAEETSAEELNLGLLCFIAYRSMEGRILEELAQAGFADLTPSQGRIAARIGPNGTRMSALAEQALVTKQTASALVDHLERAGYVRRVHDPADARARLVVMDERGQAAVEVARVAQAKVESEWVGHLGPKAAKQLRAALERLREITDPYA